MPNESTSGIVSRKQAAAEFNVTPQALSLWAAEPWFPRDAVETDARGRKVRWNVPAIRAARAAIGEGRDNANNLDDVTRKAKAKRAIEEARRAELENEKRRLALEEQRGRLVPREAVELFAATLLTGLGDWAEQLPDLAAGVVPKKYRKKIKDFLKTELDNRRQQTAADLERAARDFDSRHKEGSDGQKETREENAG